VQVRFLENDILGTITLDKLNTLQVEWCMWTWLHYHPLICRYKDFFTHIQINSPTYTVQEIKTI
jgi:hypothetical protein